MRARVSEALQQGSYPAGGVVLVGDAGIEREWSAAGRLAGYVPADGYFGGAG